MWARTFDTRLANWSRLRIGVANLCTQQSLEKINDWWFDSPWRAYHLHWDDRATWPDPWQLLDDNIYCSIARGLGIMYTISLIDRADLQNARLVDTGNDNLVLVDGEKYILNWDRDTVVNRNLTPFDIRRCLTLEQVKKYIK